MSTLTALSHIRHVHFVVFSVSWVAFFVTGKVFFEYGLGFGHHSSGNKLWGVTCKLLFLTTFVIACTLLELLSLEILDVMHAQLRELAWTVTLGVLCLLLNLLIPASIVISIGLQMGLTWVQISLYALNLVVLFQTGVWALGEVLPLSVIGRHPSLLQYFSSLPFSVPQSVAHLTVIGSATAAVISGFATVSFPLQQLMMFRGSHSDVLRNREDALKTMTIAICREKKQLLLKRRRSSADSPSSSAVPASKPPSSRLTLGALLSSIPALSALEDLASRQLYPSLKRKTSISRIEPPEEASSVSAQERRAEDLFFEVVHLRELLSMSADSQTLWGRLLHIAGYLFSAVGIFRVYTGLQHLVVRFLGEGDLNGVALHEGEDVDAVTFVSNFLTAHTTLRVDEFFWPPALTFLMVGALSLMQVRVFMSTVQDLARFGLLSTNTDVYALLLSHFAGVYFVACVVLLRIQLPLRRRLAVTAALGSDIQFDFFVLWFDLFFVLSAIFFGVVLLMHHVRKQRCVASMLLYCCTESPSCVV